MIAIAAASFDQPAAASLQALDALDSMGGSFGSRSRRQENDDIRKICKAAIAKPLQAFAWPLLSPESFLYGFLETFETWETRDQEKGLRSLGFSIAAPGSLVSLASA